MLHYIRVAAVALYSVYQAIHFGDLVDIAVAVDLLHKVLGH